jgi:addiction module HigA family antidote
MKPLLCPKCHGLDIELIESATTTFRLNPWHLQGTRTIGASSAVTLACRCGHVHHLPGLKSITQDLRDRLAVNYVQLITRHLLAAPGDRQDSAFQTLGAHPAKILRDGFLIPRKITAYQVAKEIKLSEQRVYDLVNGRYRITGALDLRLCLFFGLTPGYFLRAQMIHEMLTATKKHGRKANKEIRPLTDSTPRRRRGRPKGSLNVRRRRR